MRESVAGGFGGVEEETSGLFFYCDALKMTALRREYDDDRN